MYIKDLFSNGFKLPIDCSKAGRVYLISVYDTCWPGGLVCRHAASVSQVVLKALQGEKWFCGKQFYGDHLESLLRPGDQ